MPGSVQLVKSQFLLLVNTIEYLLSLIKSYVQHKDYKSISSHFLNLFCLLQKMQREHCRLEGRIDLGEEIPALRELTRLLRTLPSHSPLDSSIAPAATQLFVGKAFAHSRELYICKPVLKSSHPLRTIKDQVGRNPPRNDVVSRVWITYRR